MWCFAVANLVLAILLALGVFGGLTARAWMVDGPVGCVVLLWSVTALELLRGGRFRLRWLRISAWCSLSLGLAVIAALSVSISYLSGVHGDLGERGALQMLFVIVAAVPYLVIYPALQLAWVQGRTDRRT